MGTPTSSDRLVGGRFAGNEPKTLSSKWETGQNIIFEVGDGFQNIIFEVGDSALNSKAPAKMEDGGALPPADAEPAVQQPQKAQRGQKGLPRNIIESKVFRKKTQQWAVKYQARVHFKLPKDDKPTPHAVGGLHDTVEAAVAAQQEAKRMIEEYGAAAVWPKAFDKTAAARCKRGTAPPRNDGGGGRKKAAKPAGAQERTEPKYGRLRPRRSGRASWTTPPWIAPHRRCHLGSRCMDRAVWTVPPWTAPLEIALYGSRRLGPCLLRTAPSRTWS